jgi:hypothetical protein
MFITDTEWYRAQILVRRRFPSAPHSLFRMVCWYLCLATSVCSHVPTASGSRRPRSLRQEGRRRTPLGPLEDTPACTLVLLRCNGHWSGDESILTRSESG